MKHITIDEFKNGTMIILLTIVIVLVLFIIKDWSIIDSQNELMDKQEQNLRVCNNYINDLETAIESQDLEVVDVCGTDSYCEYYNIYGRN